MNNESLQTLAILGVLIFFLCRAVGEKFPRFAIWTAGLVAAFLIVGATIWAWTDLFHAEGPIVGMLGLIFVAVIATNKS